ncbi:MAG: hypothetical protein FJ398_21765 [Verrucomicrobia bacterium]|nr:hypothetical protein [Verrucomicrobiota bacterium]
MNLWVGRACPQRAESDVFHARPAARRDGLALPSSWAECRVLLEQEAFHKPGRAALPRSRSSVDAAAQQRRPTIDGFMAPKSRLHP